ECSFEIKTDPSASQVVRFCGRLAILNQPRIAHGYDVILPITGDLLDPCNHLFWRHFRPRRKPSGLLFPGGKNLDVGPSNIDNEHFHGVTPRLEKNPAGPGFLFPANGTASFNGLRPS